MKLIINYTNYDKCNRVVIWALICFLIFCFTSTMSNLIINTDYLLLIGIMLIICCSILAHIKLFIPKKIGIMYFTSFCYLVLSCFISQNKLISAKYVFQYSVLWLVYFLLTNYEIRSTLILICKTLSVIFSFATVCQLIFPQLYIIFAKICFGQGIYNTGSNAIVSQGLRFTGLATYTGNNAFLSCIGILCFLHDDRKSSFRKKIGLVLCITSLILSGSRLVLISLIISTIVLSFLCRKKGAIKPATVFLIILLPFIFMIIYGIVINSPVLLSRFTDAGTVASRKIMQDYAMNLFQEHRWLGQGINTYIIYQKDLGLAVVTYAHNVYIQLLFETGILGVIFIIPIYFYIFFRSYKELRYRKVNKLPFADVKIVFSIQFIFLMYFFTGNPIYDMNTLLILLIFSSTIKQNADISLNTNIYIRKGLNIG